MLKKTMEQSPEGKTYFHSILKSNFHTRSIFQSQCLPSEGLWKPCSEEISSHKSYLGHLGGRSWGGGGTTQHKAWSYFLAHAYSLEAEFRPHASSLGVLQLPPPFL